MNLNTFNLHRHYFRRHNSFSFKSTIKTQLFRKGTLEKGFCYVVVLRRTYITKYEKVISTYVNNLVNDSHSCHADNLFVYITRLFTSNI